MKKLLYIIPLFLTFFAHATNYYISNAGNNSNNGTSTSTTWLNITKVNATTFSPGDSILFKRGDTFTGGLITGANGTSLAPIVYGAYGAGSLPIITGFTTASGFSLVSSGVYVSTAVSSLSTCNYVLVNDVPYGMGRYPSQTTGYLTVTSANSTSLTGTFTGSWIGATIFSRNTNFWVESAVISAQSGSTLTYGGFASTTIPGAGAGFFIQNDMRTLANFGDWFYNTSTKVMNVFFGSGGVGSNVVKCASIDNVITVNNSNVVIQNISITGSNSHAVHINNTGLSNISFINSTVQYCNYGIDWSDATNITCSGNSFADIHHNAINSNNTINPIITNNTITRIGLFVGMATYVINAINVSNSQGSLVANNNITNTAYNGIGIDGGNNYLFNNYINGTCQLFDDGGAIYTQLGISTNKIGNKIFGNLILNCFGNAAGSAYTGIRLAHGIYLDGHSHGYEIDYNSIAHVTDYGLFLNGSYDINAHNNNWYDTHASLGIAQFDATPVTGINYQYNSSFALTGQLVMQINYFVGSGTTNTLGTINNNRYCRPSDENNIFYSFIQSTNITQTFSLAGWQAAFPNNDQNSLGTPTAYTGGSTYYLYNAPGNNVTQLADATYQAPDGNYVFINGQTMQVPLYCGAVLLKVGGYPHYY